MRKAVLILLILLVGSVPVRGATVYKWVDKEGVVNFTDDREKIPPIYRNRVEVETREDIPRGKPPAPEGMVSPKKEATGSYESVHHRVMEKAEELSQRRFGSPTQYKMNIIELDRLKDEMTEYQARIDEANETLGNLSKQAEEAKADPEWLK